MNNNSRTRSGYTSMFHRFLNALTQKRRYRYQNTHFSVVLVKNIIIAKFSTLAGTLPFLSRQRTTGGNNWDSFNLFAHLFMERFKFFNFKNCWLFESAIFCDFRCIPIRVGSHSGHSFEVAASLTPEIRANTRYALRNDSRAFHFATPNIRNKISINTESVGIQLIRSVGSIYLTRCGQQLI